MITATRNDLFANTDAEYEWEWLAYVRPLDELGDWRGDAGGARVSELRRQIAEGTYLTDDKIEVVANLLVDKLRSEGVGRGGVAA